MADTTAPSPAIQRPLRKAPPPPRSALVRKLPWNDKAGRFAPLKALTLVLVPIPAIYLAVTYWTVGLGPRPTIEALHFIGRWTIWFLLITLSITPVRRMFDWNKLIQIRRIIGLTALYYILLHVTIYLVDSGYNLAFVVSEIAIRIYLTIGFTAILCLVALGVTSTDGMIKRMGALPWNRLHRLIYLIGVLGFVHYFMQSKLDITEAALYGGFFLWLMGYRVMVRLGWKQGLVPLLVLAVAAAVATALVEYGWYLIIRPPLAFRILEANLSINVDLGIFRPAGWALFVGLAIAAAAEGWRRLGGARTRSPRPARA